MTPEGDTQEPPARAELVPAWLRRNSSWVALTLVLVLLILPRVSPFEGLNSYLNVGQRLSEWVLRRVERLFTNYGYYVVFLGVLLENTLFLGLLVPGAIILILAGLAAENGSINLALVLALGIAATLIGDTISYAIGRLGWAKALERGSLAGAVERVRAAAESRGHWFILAYHFAGYSRLVGPAAAGLFRIPYRRWAPFDYAGATLWVLTFTMIGVAMGMLGVQFGDTRRIVRLLELLFTAAIVAAVVVTLYRSSRARRAAAPLPVQER
ncbi:MAG TPA: DedA family protein [Dehalococcoidia bacterium]|nr:DedA family protein [Dehalococcoidia bacterium]